jgi:allantoicase
VNAFDTLPDLVSQALGGSVVAANDEFFAARDNLVSAHPPSFTPRTFGAKGQVYDGWETRRRREPGFDHAIVRLGAPGVVRGVVVDTAFFTGNYPPHASVEGCGVEGYPSPAELAGADWFPLVPRSPLHGDTRNPFTVDDPRRVTHVRLCIYPDGGVSRLRVHGEPLPDPRYLPPGLVDLAAVEHGGRVVGCSDMHYGAPGNLILPGLARVMGEGWETARRRDDGNDWVLVRLAVPGRIRLADLDTSHFKGNAPGAAALHGDSSVPLLPRTRLQPDTRHRFRIADAPPASHVRLDIYPDGGMARLRLYGEIDPAERDALALRWFNALPASQALAACGLPPDAAQALVSARPLTDPTALPASLRWPGPAAPGKAG